MTPHGRRVHVLQQRLRCVEVGLGARPGHDRDAPGGLRRRRSRRRRRHGRPTSALRAPRPTASCRGAASPPGVRPRRRRAHRRRRAPGGWRPAAAPPRRASRSGARPGAPGRCGRTPRARPLASVTVASRPPTRTCSPPSGAANESPSSVSIPITASAVPSGSGPKVAAIRLAGGRSSGEPTTTPVSANPSGRVPTCMPAGSPDVTSLAGRWSSPSRTTTRPAVTAIRMRAAAIDTSGSHRRTADRRPSGPEPLPPAAAATGASTGAGDAVGVEGGDRDVGHLALHGGSSSPGSGIELHQGLVLGHRPSSRRSFVVRPSRSASVWRPRKRWTFTVAGAQSRISAISSTERSSR